MGKTSYSEFYRSSDIDLPVKVKIQHFEGLRGRQIPQPCTRALPLVRLCDDVRVGWPALLRRASSLVPASSL
jgi:hypothetical protein